VANNIAKETNDNSMIGKALLNVNSIIGSLPTDTIIEQNNSNDENIKRKNFKKVVAHDRVILALNSDKK